MKWNAVTESEYTRVFGSQTYTCKLVVETIMMIPSLG